VKFGRKPKLSDHQRQEALKRRAAGETLTEIARSYAVDASMISRLS
jgi:Helix-turn-helix domain of resolvase